MVAVHWSRYFRMVCPLSVVVVARRQCQPFLMARTVSYMANGSGNGKDLGSDVSESNNISEFTIVRPRNRSVATVSLTARRFTTKWSIWRVSSNSRCNECGKPLKNIPPSASK